MQEGISRKTVPRIRTGEDTGLDCAMLPLRITSHCSQEHRIPPDDARTIRLKETGITYPSRNSALSACRRLLQGVRFHGANLSRARANLKGFIRDIIFAPRLFARSRYVPLPREGEQGEAAATFNNSRRRFCSRSR